MTDAADQTRPAGHTALTGSPPPASSLAPPEADAFYRESLRILAESGIPFLSPGRSR